MTSKKVCLNVWRNAHAIVTAVQGEIAARWIEVSLYDHDKRLDISEKTAAIFSAYHVIFRFIGGTVPVFSAFRLPDWQRCLPFLPRFSCPALLSWRI